MSALPTSKLTIKAEDLVRALTTLPPVVKKTKPVFILRRMYEEYEDEQGGSSLPVFKSASVLQRTSSPVLGASPSGLGGTTAGGKGPTASVDAKGKGGGKKRKSEAADKQPKTAVSAAGEDGGTPAKKKKKPAQPKKTEKKNDVEGGSTKVSIKGVSGDQNQDKEKMGAEEGSGEGDGKDPKDEAGEDEDDVDSAEDVDAMDDKYKEMQEARNRVFQDQLKTKADWERYKAMRRANLNDREMKALIAAASDTPESQLKPPIIFTIKGMAKVLVGQLVDNARLVRREWGEDDSNGVPLQPRHILESHRRMMRQGGIPPTTTSASPFSFRR